MLPPLILLQTLDVTTIKVGLATGPIESRDDLFRMELGPADPSRTNSLLAFAVVDVPSVLEIIHVDYYRIVGVYRKTNVARPVALPSLHTVKLQWQPGWRHTITDRHIPQLADIFTLSDGFSYCECRMNILEHGVIEILLPAKEDRKPPRGHGAD
jgi:hypothetical protein